MSAKTKRPKIKGQLKGFYKSLSKKGRKAAFIEMVERLIESEEIGVRNKSDKDIEIFWVGCGELVGQVK